MTPPENVKQVRQFLGLSGYFRKFAKDYSRIVEPLLTPLTRKDVKWCWEAVVLGGRAATGIREGEVHPYHETCIGYLQSPIADRTAHWRFRPRVGSYITARTWREQRVVAYYSKQTTVDQREYHWYELETMAVVNALKHFCVYLLGMKFTVVTDCNALKAAFSKKDLIPRIGRWWLEVQDYTFQIKYRITHVDALRRYPVVDIEVNNVDLTESDWLVSAQLQDEQLKRIRNILESKIKNNEIRQYFELYQPKDLLFSGITYYL
jgi:hypothetical protein